MDWCFVGLHLVFYKHKYSFYEIDKSYPTINEYSRNKRQPSLEDLYKIAEILQVNAKDLLVDSENNNGK